MTRYLQLRACEWILVAFFVYTSFLPLFVDGRSIPALKPLFIAVAIFILVALLSRLEHTRWALAVDRVRDWIPIGLTLAAFREMELFLPAMYDTRLEASWIALDRLVLGTWHLRAAIESLGAFLPSVLELAYFLVYGVAAYCIGLLYARQRRPDCDRFYVFYLLGTLTAYGLFPFFPSQPPRYAFPGVCAPQVRTALHSLNVAVLKGATIHVGVFPSAHVSSAFSAAWALFALFPERKRYGWIALLYSVLVSIATIYGRYHYVADVLAGFVVSLIPAAVAFYWAYFSQPEPSTGAQDSIAVITESR